MRTFDFSLSRPKPRPHIRCVLDCETFAIAPLVQAPPPVSMSFNIDGGKVHTIAASDPLFDSVVEALFLDDRILIVAHNAKFDLCVLMAHGAHIGKAVEWAQMILRACHLDRVTCTQLREFLYHIALAKYDLNDDNAFPSNLGACAERWETKTRPNKQDEWRVRYGTLAHLHVREWPAAALKYVEEDVRACDEVFVAQETKAPWLVDQHRQLRSSVSLYLKQCWGFRSDPAQAAKLYEKTAAELQAAAELCKTTTVTYQKTKTRSVKKQKVSYELEVTEPLRNPDGSANKKAVETYMVRKCQELGISLKRGKPTEKMLDKDPDHPGNVKLDAEACEATRDPILIAYTESGQAATLLAKVKRWSKPVLQPSYETLKATGRTSVRQGQDPKPGEAPRAHGVQVQNPPKAVMGPCPACASVGCAECKFEGEVEVPGVREIMVARPGKVILDIDFTGLEQCMLAQVEYWFWGHSALGEIVNNPKRSALVETGARIMGLTVEEAWALKKTDPAAFKKMRNMAKGPEYGTPGGMGWKRGMDYCWQQYGVRITEERAREIFGFKGKDIWQQFKPFKNGQPQYVDVPGIIKEIYPERQPYLDIMNTGVCPKNKVGARVVKGSRGMRVTHPYSGRVRGGVGYSDGNNNWFQGLGADCAKESDWRVCVKCYAAPTSPLFGFRPIAFIHDQVLVEGPEEGYVAAARRLEELWVSGAQEICTDVLIQAKPACTRRWSKAGGDAVYWEDGSLAVFEDFMEAQKK